MTASWHTLDGQERGEMIQNNFVVVQLSFQAERL